MIKWTRFNTQMWCEYCQRYQAKDDLILPMGRWFHVGCFQCRHNRVIYISKHMKVAQYDQYSTNSALVNGGIAFGYTRMK